jgi:hypothetical protein
MCAEAVWRRCHRPSIVDYLIAAGDIVFQSSARIASSRRARVTDTDKPRPGGSLSWADLRH